MNSFVFAEMSPDPHGGEGRCFAWARVVLKTEGMATTLFDFLNADRANAIAQQENLKVT